MTRKNAEYWAKRGVPEARFVVAVKRSRAEGAPQYGERFTAWLKQSGMTEDQIRETIQKLS